MRRICILWVLLHILAVPTRAAGDRPYAAVVIDSGSSGKYTRQLLDGLYDRGIRATFLLQGSRMAQDPELVQRIRQEGHEIACRGYTGENMAFMSRRDIAREIMDFQALLPQGFPLKLFCPPGGCTDAVRQVAEVRHLAILSWSAEPENGAEDALRQIQDGDVILLRDRSSGSVQGALALIDGLWEKDFRFLTVSQLAQLRQARLKPGQIYSRFPAEPGDST